LAPEQETIKNCLANMAGETSDLLFVPRSGITALNLS